MPPYSSFFSGDLPSGPEHTQPDQLTIEYRAAEELIAVRWVGSCTMERLRDVYVRVAALLQRTDAHRVLFDTRERAVIGEEAARWVATEAYSVLLDGRTTPLRLAYAVPEAVVEAFGGGQPETLSERLRVGVFATPGAAIAWLRQS